MRSSFLTREKMRRKPSSGEIADPPQGCWRLRRGWCNRKVGKIQHQLQRGVIVGSVRDERRRQGPLPVDRQVAASHCIGGVAGGERKDYSRSSIRGNQMNLVDPSAA
jgi:hypothetical protein